MKIIVITEAKILVEYEIEDEKYVHPFQVRDLISVKGKKYNIDKIAHEISFTEMGKANKPTYILTLYVTFDFNQKHYEYDKQTQRKGVIKAAKKKLSN